MNDRIKKLRKALDLTQQGFADRIGSKRTTIAKYETGTNIPSSAVISLICREFNVNETWLRTGEGEMFIELPKNEALAAQIQAFLQGGTDSFRERLVSLLLRLAPEQWDVLEGYLIELMKERPAPAEPRSQREQPEAAEEIVPHVTDPELEAEVEAFRQRRILEKKQASQTFAAKERGAG